MNNAGSVHVFGEDASNDRVTALSNIGTIIESPGLYRNLNARHGVGKNRIDEVLFTVGHYMTYIISYGL